METWALEIWSHGLRGWKLNPKPVSVYQDQLLTTVDHTDPCNTNRIWIHEIKVAQDCWIPVQSMKQVPGTEKSDEADLL